MDPVAESFRRIVEEIYWQESLEEAERTLEERIRNMDRDLRELLLERRREYCGDPKSVLSVLSLEALLSSDDNADSTEKKLAVLKAMVSSAFLLQCTPTWQELDSEEKAWILAPLYRASYGLELASKGSHVDEFHLSHAVEMLEIALQRAEMLGLIEEMREHIEKLASKLLEESI
ncbi:MAG: hypothetical protein F7B20_00915 [Aeropyrum sp.]|nr:hypothetical protein [Aeropyrum sp.]MCE4616523.1 hypothetical protein [Aeropyrum sp.]